MQCFSKPWLLIKALKYFKSFENNLLGIHSSAMVVDLLLTVDTVLLSGFPLGWEWRGVRGSQYYITEYLMH